MHELLDTLVSQLRGAWRFRWLAVGACWIVAGVGWTAVWSLPNTYEAHARVYVDTESVLRPLLAGLAVGTDAKSDVTVMSTVLLSRPNLEKVVKETGLYLRANSTGEMENLVESLRASTTLSGAPDGTWTIAFADHDRTIARRVVDTLLNTFVDDSLGNKRADQDTAQVFLQQQIQEYEVRLRDAEERLAEFKRDNVGQMPDQTGDYYARLQKSLADAEVLRAKLRQLTERRNEIARQLEGEEPTFGIVTPQSGASSDPKIVALKNRLDQLLVQYTDKHPEVIALRETIASLEAERKQKRGAAEVEAETVDPNKLAIRALDMNPVYQSMKISLSQADAELAEVRSQLNDAEHSVAMLRGKVNVIPEVEARLAQLNRDYEVNRAQYTQLVQRLESARISREAAQSTDKVKFRVIEPPMVPEKPVGPKRLILLTLVLVASLVAGIALAFAMNQAKPAFSTRKSVQDAIGLPVLGSIQLVDDRAHVSVFRGQPAMVGAMVALLVVVYIGNMVAA